MHKGCGHCRGSGKLLGLGNLKMKCHYCEGIGWVEDNAAEEDKLLSESPKTAEIVPIIKRRGRKPGVKYDEAKGSA